MEIKKEILKDAIAVKITAHDEGRQVGRLYLYILKNDLHKEPFAFLEDVFVEESHRKHGIGSGLVKKAIEEAKTQGCYKILGNSRMSAENVHAFYERLGFKKHGFEFRIDFN